jgi:excinuclease ABC subunit C
VRDEAHRFAINYHRHKRGKAATTSALDDIPGLGPARRAALLKHFGSVRAVSQASPEQIAEVSGIGPRLAETIMTSLRVGSTASSTQAGSTASSTAVSSRGTDAGHGAEQRGDDG